MTRSMLFGIVAAGLAALSWSLGFIVPFVIGGYSVFDFTLIEYVVSGLLSLAILWRHAPAVRELNLRDWLTGGSLGLIGYLGYFLAVMGAAVYAGPVIAPAFLGLVPVVLGVAGNLRDRTVPWASLALPMTLAAVGLLLVNGGGLIQSAAAPANSLIVGIPLALVAVACWTTFGMLNQAALARRPRMNASVWTALILAGTGLAMLLFFPVGTYFGLFAIPRLGLHWHDAAPLLLWATGLALFANLGGALAWTYAAQRLPVALAAQMITMEPASAAILGLAVHRRWPTVMEVCGMSVLLVGVIIAIGLFSRAEAARAAAATPAPATA